MTNMEQEFALKRGTKNANPPAVLIPTAMKELLEHLGVPVLHIIRVIPTVLIALVLERVLVA